MPEELRLTRADHTFEGRVASKEDPVWILQPDLFRDGVEDRAQPRALLDQRGLGALALGDVAHRDVESLPAVLHEGGRGDLDLDDRAVEADDPLLRQRRGLPGLPHALDPQPGR